MSQYGKVAVLFGGDSAEREVSLNSGTAVLNGLLQAGVDAHGFDPAEQPLAELVEQGFARALIMLHGRGGEDGTVQGALQSLGVAYSGSGVLGSALAMDKGRSKRLWQALNLPTAAYEIVEKSRFDEGSCSAIIEGLGNALMVKPTREGSSIGMAKVSSVSELNAAIQHAFEYDNQVLVERFIQGQEFTVGLLQGKALPSITMRTPRVFYDYQAKYQADSTEYFCPSGLSQQQEAELGQLALQAFQALDCSGWGRVDFMRDAKDNWYLLEVNTVPGMTEKSLVPMAAAQQGMSFSQLCEAVLQTAEQPR